MLAACTFTEFREECHACLTRNPFRNFKSCLRSGFRRPSWQLEAGFVAGDCRKRAAAERLWTEPKRLPDTDARMAQHCGDDSRTPESGEGRRRAGGLAQVDACIHREISPRGQ